MIENIDLSPGNLDGILSLEFFLSYSSEMAY